MESMWFLSLGARYRRKRGSVSGPPNTAPGSKRGSGGLLLPSRIGSVVNPYITLVILYVIGDIPYGYGSIPINTIFRGMNIHLPAILMFTRGTRFWHTAIYDRGYNPFTKWDAPLRALREWNLGMEHPRRKWRLRAGKIIRQMMEFSSKPCLMNGGYIFVCPRWPFDVLKIWGWWWW